MLSITSDDMSISFSVTPAICVALMKQQDRETGHKCTKRKLRTTALRGLRACRRWLSGPGADTFQLTPTGLVLCFTGRECVSCGIHDTGALFKARAEEHRLRPWRKTAACRDTENAHLPQGRGRRYRPGLSKMPLKSISAYVAP